MNFANPVLKVQHCELSDDYGKLELSVWVNGGNPPGFVEYDGKVYEFFRRDVQVGRSTLCFYLVVS